MTDNTVVRQSVVVDAPVERAFATFTQRMVDFKPREHTLLHSPVADTIFEPRVGGNILDRGEDGSECRWARILAYEPPDRVVFSWDIGPTWQIEDDPELTSEVEVRFLPDGPQRLASNSSTATSIDTDRAGRRCAMESGVPKAGRCTWTGMWRSSRRSPPERARQVPWHGSGQFSPVTRRPRDQFLHAGMMDRMAVVMSREAFEDLVAEALDLIPEQFIRAMDNVVVLVADRHPTRSLYGLYHGVALTSRSSSYSGTCPTLSRSTANRSWRTPDRGRGQGAGGHHGDP